MIKCLYIIQLYSGHLYIGISRNPNTTFKKIFSKSNIYDIKYEPMYVYKRVYNISEQDCCTIINRYMWVHGNRIILSNNLQINYFIM
jgi:hypothetical protein